MLGTVSKLKHTLKVVIRSDDTCQVSLVSMKILCKDGKEKLKMFTFWWRLRLSLMMKKSVGYCVHVMAAGPDGYVAATLQMMFSARCKL